MKLIDWILLIAVAALLIFAFWLVTRKQSSCHGCGQKDCCAHKHEARNGKCEHCEP